MASFQVEVASSSSTFGYVMRNPSRRDRCSSGGSSSFPDNLKDLMNSCISGEPRTSDVDSNENVNKIVDITDLWVHKPQYATNNDRNAEKSPKKKNVKACDNWDNARKKVLAMEKKDEDNEGLAGQSSEARRGVSSIVQKWRDFEAEGKTVQPANNNNSSTISRTNSGIPENSELPPSSSVAGDESSEGTGTSPTNDDSSFVDWESDRRVVSAPPSVRGRDSDVTESERVRVIDIIKKLTSSEENQEREQHNSNAAVIESSPPPPVKTSASAAQSCFCPLLYSPRIIRGRQAYKNLLVQMERDRVRELEGITERKAVSKFQQKGRIQAMLKLKFLRRELEVVKDPQPSSCMSPESMKSTQSSIMHLREKFKKGVQQALAESKSTSKQVQENNNSEPPRTVPASKPKKQRRHPEATHSISRNKEGRNVSSSKQLQEENRPPEVVEKKSTDAEMEINMQPTDKDCIDLDKEIPQTQGIQVPRNKSSDQPNCKGESSFKNDQIKEFLNCQQTKSNHVQQHDSAKESSKNFNEDERRKRVKSKVRCDNESTKSAETTKPVSKSEDTGRNNELTESAETTKLVSKSEDTVSDKEQRNSNEWTCDWEENDWSWLSDYTHPQGGWDQLQFDFPEASLQQEETEVSQDWIIDVSRPRSEWEDLRQARYQEMLDPFFNNDDLQKLLQRKSVSSFLSGGMRDKIDQLMISRTQNQSSPKNNGMQQIQEQVTDNKAVKVGEIVKGDRGGKAYREEEEDEDSNDYNQTWSQSQNQECDMRDDYDQMASTSLPQFQSSNFFSQVNEMKLIHGLMGHMEQLHQEMSEIRRAIISCIDMQVKLQHSIKNEVASAFNQLEGKQSGRICCSSKRNCSICQEMEVDSLLYRCGHMCTCFKCGKELQTSEGKCPMCEAPIMDVVRAYADA